MRPAREVGERVVGLTALLMRLEIVGGGDRAQLARWLAGEGVEPLLSPNERAIVHATELDDMVVFDAQWRLQAVAALVWALGRSDATPPYQPTAAEDIEALLPAGTPIAPLLASARLRPDSELLAACERLELWHWRVNTELLRLQGMVPPAGDSFDAVVARAAARAREEGLIDGVRGDDFDCGGVAFGELGDDLGAACSTIIERRYAMSWLVGDDDWDDVSPDT